MELIFDPTLEKSLHSFNHHI